MTVEIRNQNTGGVRQHVINRLMGADRLDRDQRDAGNQALNMNRVLGQMQEHQDPKPAQ